MVVKATESGSRRLAQRLTSDGSDPSANWNSASWSDQTDGDPVPDYKRRIRKHISATGPFSGFRFTLQDTAGYSSIIGFVPETRTTPNRWFNSKGGPHGGLITPFAVGSVPSGTASNDAAGAFYANVRNAMSGFKGSVFAAESRDARRMMVDRGQRMLNAIGPYQNRLRKRWYGTGSKRARLKRLSDSWLELQFGWAPLISDIEDAHRVLNNPTPQYKRVIGEGNHGSASEVDYSEGVIGIARYQQSYRESTHYYRKYYGEVKARASPTGSVLQDFGLTTREFLPTAWEVIPWSFAVDYFTNIGKIVTAASYASADTSWVASLTRIKRTRTRTCVWVKLKDSGGNRYIEQNAIPSTSTGEATSFIRTGVTNVPIPVLQWQLPSWKQGLNLAALAVSKRLRLFHDR